MNKTKKSLLESNNKNSPDLWCKIEKALPQKEKRKTYINICNPFKLASVCVAVVIVISVLSVKLVDNNSIKIASDSSSVVIQNNASPKQSAQVNNNKGTINVMELQNMPERNISMFALLSKDFIPMTTQQLVDYYGTNFIPKNIPNGIFEAVGKMGTSENSFGIYKRNGGTGEVYWDQNTILWVDAKNTYNYVKSISVICRKGILPFNSLFDVSKDKNNPVSIINGVEVSIGHYSDKTNDLYYSQFFYNNIGFEIDMQNISKDDLIKTISSVID